MENEIKRKIEEALKNLGNVKVIEIKGNVLEDLPDDCQCGGHLCVQDDEPTVTIPLCRYNNLIKNEVLYEQIIFLSATHDSYDLGRILKELLTIPKKERPVMPEEKHEEKAETPVPAPEAVEEALK